MAYGLSDMIGDVGGGFIDSASWAYKKSWADDAVSAFHVDDAGKALWHKALEPTFAGLEFVYRNGVSRPVSTLMLMQDDEIQHNLGWRGAWDESRNISPGQAFTNSMAQRLDDVSQKVGIDNPLEWVDSHPLRAIPGLGDVKPFWFFGDDIENSFEELTGSGGKSSFDILNEEQRKAVFSHNFAKGMSGISDTAMRWFLDPTVIAGKAAMIGRTRLLVRPLDQGTLGEGLRNSVREGTALDAMLPLRKVETAEQTTERLDRAFDPGTTTGRRMQDVAGRYMAMSEGERRVALLKDKNIGRRNVPAAEILARSADEEDFIARLRTMMNPTDANITALATKKSAAWDDFVQYTDARAKGLEDSLREAEQTYGLVSRRGQISDIGPALMRKREAWDSRQAYRRGELMARQRWEFDSLIHDAAIKRPAIPPRVLATQRIGAVAGDASDAARRAIRGTDPGRIRGLIDAPTQAIYQPSRFSAVRVVRSAVTQRVGTVRIDDPDSAVREVSALLLRSGHGVRQTPGRGVGISKELHAQLIKDVSDAVALKDPTKVMDAVRAAETAVIKHNAAQIGIRPDVAEALYQRFNARRTTTIQTYSAKTGDPSGPNLRVRSDPAGNPLGRPAPADPAFSGAKAEGAAAEDPYSDMWFDADDGTYTHMPMGNTDLANTIPMIDIDAFTRLMRKEKLSLDAEGDSLIAFWKNELIGGDSGAVAVGELAKVAMENFNRIWKPLQLFRLGWPVRVVVDEQMRMMATLGAADYMEVMTQSVGNSLEHGWGGVRIKDAANASRRRIAQEATFRKYETPERRIEKMSPHREEGRERLKIIDELDELTQADAGLNVRLEYARRRLETAVADNEGVRIYRSAPPNSPIRPDDFGTDFRYDLPEEVLSRTHVHQYTLADLPEEQIFRAAGDGSRPGTAYLDQAVDDVGDLRTSTNAELRRRILEEFPNAKIAKYRTKDDLLEAYGRQHARANGYKAIETGDVGVTALTRDAIRKVDPDEARAYAQLEDLQEMAMEQAAHRVHLTSDMEPLRAWTLQMETDWNRVQRKAVKYRQLERGHELRPHKFAGSIVLSKNGVDLAAPDALQGALGRQFADLTSADTTTRALTNGADKHLQGLRLAGGDQLTVSSYVDDTMTSADRTLRRKTYDKGWENAVNRQIGTDAMLSQLVMGHGDDEILDWMRNTEQGRAYMKKAPSILRENPEEWIQRGRVHVDHYLRTPEMRESALAGNANAKQLRDWGKSQGLTENDLPIVHAQSLDLVTGTGAFESTWGRLVDFMYAKIGTAPTDVLSRHPFFTAVTRREMQRQYDAMGLTSADNVTPHQIEQMQSQARDVGLKEVKRTLYDVANQSNLGHTMRFVMPFYAAWQDALMTWSRLFMEDPSRLARMSMAWEAPSKSAQTYTSPDGTTYMATPMPGFLKKALMLDEDALMPADALRSLIAQGDYWYLPGFGAPVTVPVSTIVRERPDLEELLKPVLPYGAGDSYLSQVLPAGWKRGKSLFNEEDDADYSKAVIRLSQEVYVENRQNGTHLTDVQMWDEAKRRANALFTTRMAANLSLPFSPKINSPYQLYIDGWRTMQEQYRTDPQAFGGKSAQDAFIDKYGEDYFIFTLAATKSNVGGIAPTVEGYEQFNEYRDLVREMPEMGSLIVGDTSGEYSDAVADWMLGERIGPGDARHLRDIRDPNTAFKDAETNRGWALFRQIDNATDSAMIEAGYKSLRSKGAAPIKLIRDALIANVKAQYPAWAEEFGTFDRGKADRRVAFMEKLVDDPRIRAREGMGSLIQYLGIRRQMVAALAERKQAGGSLALTANTNADLKLIFDTLVTNLREKDTKFADLHTRWLSSDDLDTGGVI